MEPQFAGSTVYEYVSAKWGGPTRLVPLASVIVGVTPVRAALNNPRRFELVILNVSVAQMSLGFDGGITAGNGIILPPAGSFVARKADEGGGLVTDQARVIAGPA